MLINLFLTGEGSAADAAGILACGKEYLYIMNFGLLPFDFSTAYATTLRECGETLVPMISSFAAMFCNLILNYILIFGHFGVPAMGVAGAAVATVISRYLELVIVAVWAHSHKVKFPFIQGLYRSLRIPGNLMKQMMTKVAPLILNEALWSTAITFQIPLSAKGEGYPAEGSLIKVKYAKLELVEDSLWGSYVYLVVTDYR